MSFLTLARKRCARSVSRREFPNQGTRVCFLRVPPLYWKEESQGKPNSSSSGPSLGGRPGSIQPIVA